MAQSKLSTCDEEKSLECTICLSDFTKPKLLACLHTFCMTCLKRYCKEIDEEEKPCPLCRKEFFVPEGGVEMLKTDQVKTRLVLEKQTREGKQKLPECDICENADAEAYCVECKQGICSACRKGHLKISSTKLHKIVGMDEKPSEETLQKIKSQYCTIHAGKQIELYCCDCEKLLCYSCHATEHNKHMCKVPSEVAKSKREELLKSKNRVAGCIEDERRKVNDFKAGPIAHLKEISEAQEVVGDAFIEIIRHLDEKKSKFFNRLREMREEKLKTVKSEDYVSEFRCAELNTFLEYSRMMVERGTDYEILTIENELHMRANKLIQSQKKRNAETVPPISSLQLLSHVASEIEELKNVVFKMELQQTQDWNRLLNNSRVKSFESAEGCHYGIVIHNSAVYMTSNGSPCILVYNLQNLSKVSGQISVPGLNDAIGLVYNESDSCLYVSNFYPGGIYKINKLDNSVTSWALQNGQPWGISLSKQKNLLVSYYSHEQVMRLKLNLNTTSSEVMPVTIDEFNGSGQLIRCIKLSEYIAGIYHSIELTTGEFIVCQSSPLHRVCLVDSLGNVIKSYGKYRGSGVGELYNPHHLELDRKGNILVTDYNNRKLRVLTSDLQYVGDVGITDTELEYPTCTCWDKENDRLLVTTGFKSFYAISPQE